MPDENFSKTTRIAPVRDRRRSKGSWLPGIIVGIAGLLLIAMVAAAQLDGPPPVAQPTPIPQPIGDRLYLLSIQFSRTSQDHQALLRVLEAPTHELIYRLPGVVAASLSPEGARLYVIDATSLRAVEAASGHEIWRTPLADVAGQDGYGPAPLAVTPDGRTIVVLSVDRQFPDPGIPFYWLQLIDAATGQRDPQPIALPGDFYFARMLPAQDSASVYLLRPLKPIVPVNLIDKQVSGDTFLEASAVDASLSADGKFMYVLGQTDQQISVTVFDLATRQAVRSVKLNSADQPLQPSGGAFALLPGGDQVALGVNKVEISPFGPPGAISYNGSQVRIYATASWQELSRFEIETALTDFAFATSTLTNTIYLTTNGDQQGSVLSYHPDAQQTFEQHQLAENMFVRNLLAGPALPATWPAISLEEPVAALPPNVVPLSTTAAADDGALIGWLWQPDPGAADLIAIDSAGQQSVVEPQVQALARRPGQPPVLIAADSNEHSIVVDPLTGKRVMLEIAPGSEPYEAVLSPDGAQIAFKTRQDPFPDDEHRATTQLVICSTTTGSCQHWLDWSDTPLLSAAQPAAWANDRLYFLPSTSGMVPIWYLDLAADQPALTTITPTMNFNHERIQLDSSTGRIIYAADSQNPDPGAFSRSLILHDLETGEESVLLADIGWGPAVVSPNGHSLAHLRDLAVDGSDLVVKDLVSGAEARLGRTHYSYDTQIHWSGDSRWLLMSYNDPGLQAQSAQSLLIWDMQRKTLSHRIPVPTTWRSGPFRQYAPWPQTYLSEQRLVSVVSDLQTDYLITADLRPGTAGALGYLELPRRGLHLVYVPE